MKKTDRIFIAGHKGLVGSSVFKTLKNAGFNNLITIDRKKLDLRDFKKVEKFFGNKMFIKLYFLCYINKNKIKTNILI